VIAVVEPDGTAEDQPEPGQIDASDPPTPFDNVDVEEDVPRDGTAPAGDELTEEEKADIDNQVTEIVTRNRERAPHEQVSVSPEDVN
jgi:hypothetical protein